MVLGLVLVSGFGVIDDDGDEDVQLPFFFLLITMRQIRSIIMMGPSNQNMIRWGKVHCILQISWTEGWSQVLVDGGLKDALIPSSSVSFFFHYSSLLEFHGEGSKSGFYGGDDGGWVLGLGVVVTWCSVLGFDLVLVLHTYDGLLWTLRYAVVIYYGSK
ncbi:hypothetical protein QYF36_019836 [Acer negundo]|nr:hypothetical protein QYF36_019836 [Acer negundo]